jgi:predicted nucleic acid-binding protein
MSDVVLVDATTLIALGSVGRVDLLENFDGSIRVPERVTAEVTTEPAETNVREFLDDDRTLQSGHKNTALSEGELELLGDDQVTGDAEIVAAARFDLSHGNSVAVVSDDRRVRTVARGLGATVTGTIGVVVRAVHEGMTAEDVKDLIREIDSRGLHMTGELREKAYKLIDDAAGE